jgi:hypothetical protein
MPGWRVDSRIDGKDAENIWTVNPNSTIDAVYLAVSSYMNESQGYITAKTKYQTS